MLIGAGRLIQSFGIYIHRLGKSSQTMAVMVMKPDDLVELNREFYSGSKMVKFYCNKDLVNSGLNHDEKAILRMIPLKTGKLLLLGLGGGREAIYLSRKGFDVTGVDFVPEMINKTKKYAASHGVKIKGIVQEISNLDLALGSYDIIWLSSATYSSIPTKERRINILHKIKKILKNKGYFVCSFSFDKKFSAYSPIRELLKKAFTIISLGSFWYEKGDIIWRNSEFHHIFSSNEQLSSEFKSGGFEIIQVNIPDNPSDWSLALLRKRIPD